MKNIAKKKFVIVLTMATIFVLIMSVLMSAEKEKSFDVILKAPAEAGNDDQTEVSVNITEDGLKAAASFKADNMFPGDSITKNYYVSVLNVENVVLRFSASARNSDDMSLKDVLKCKVSVSTGENKEHEDLCNCFIKEMESVYQLDLKNANSAIYDITFYLDKDVGSEYMGKNLTIDFTWWTEYEKPENHGEDEEDIEDDKNGKGRLFKLLNCIKTKTIKQKEIIKTVKEVVIKPVLLWTPFKIVPFVIPKFIFRFFRLF